eukprot:4342943-Pyramimonas_sp.AAC.1
MFCATPRASEGVLNPTHMRLCRMHARKEDLVLWDVHFSEQLCKGGGEETHGVVWVHQGVFSGEGAAGDGVIARGRQYSTAAGGYRVPQLAR